MPQVFRRHSDYNPRPALVPRRRSSMAPPGPGPQPTDADDSIVLADLVRTGEASRLRRRGALRLDHGPAAAGRPPVGGPAGLSSYAPPSRPIVIEPSRTPSPELNPESGGDEYTYSAGSVWRDWDAAAAAGRVSSRPLDGVQTVEILNESTHAGQAFMLYCGGEEAAIEEEEEPPRRFEPSLFPGSPSSSPFPSASSSRLQGKSTHSTNGCGALVHVRAYAQRPRAVWMAKEDASESVVPLDAAYCDHPAMDKMLKSACGCIREGIGCSACGNTLGTRYVPCQAASESIFSPCPSSAESFTASRPIRPSGPSYWNARPIPLRRPSCSVSVARGSASSYYTFFADRVTATPRHDHPPHSTMAPTLVEPRRGGSQSASPVIDYGYRWTASPQPASTPLPNANTDATASNPPPLSPVFALPPLPPLGRNTSQLRPSSSARPESRPIIEFLPPVVVGTPTDEVGMDLDPDGVPLGEMEEPDSPDKEGMSWPGR
ncbi:hypothetical protein C8Q80DRAFT_1218020 [Daedaleopsis nitida]|nr:hypothetical protein C8Q80DRAFT_1218020 [Daedaleopsis nitida]